MRKKLLFLVILTLLFVPGARAQNNALYAGFGLQASRMDDMKYLQNLIMDTYPVEGKVISSFPTYITGSLGILQQYNPTLRIGGGYSYSATGAKSNYTDYSGYIGTEMQATSHRIGAVAAYSVLGWDWFELSVYGRLEVKYTSMEVTSSINALGHTDQISNKYRSISPGASAGLEFMIHLKELSIGAEGGYEIDAPGKLSYQDSKDDLLDPRDQNRVLTSDWTGWCAQVKLLYWLEN